MKRLHIITLAALLASALLLGITSAVQAVRADHSKPEIKCSDQPLEISVEEKEDGLRKGVTAWDEKDGDLTDQLLVQQVERTADGTGLEVTYAVADSDKNVTTKTRQVVYTDYTPPRFTLSGPLRYTPGSTIQVRDRLGATDVLDGTISDHIKVTASNFSSDREGTYPLTVEVTNSMGDTVKLKLKLEIRSYEPGEPKIELKQYLVYLKKNQKLDARSYLKQVTGGREEDVTVTQPEDGLKKGVNEVTYSCAGTGGVTGTAVLYVVVE